VNQKAVLAIDLGGTSIKLGLVRGGDLLLTDQLDAQSDRGLERRLPELVTRLNALLQQASLTLGDVVGIGMAMPGIVDSESRKVLVVNDKYNDAPEIDLITWTNENWGLPLWLENDTRAALLGEWHYGQGQGYDNLALMTLGTGIGTSAVIEGKLLRGKHFQAGILGGHFSINRAGIRCNCGNVGCGEAEASTWNLHNRVTAHSKYSQSVLSQQNQLDFKTIFQYADQGDQLAKAIRDECLDVWATCALNLVQAYDPEVLILGGGVMASGDFIIPPIQRKLDQNGWSAWGKVPVVAASLINSAALLGMGSLVYNGIKRL
jgi:glucokinase